MTADEIAARFDEAAATLKAMGRAERPAPIRSAMPAHNRSYFEGYGNNGDPWGLYATLAAYRERPGPPTGDAIDRLDECLSWNKWLNPNERVLIWGRAMGASWRRLAKKLNCGITTCKRWRRAALERLSGKVDHARRTP